MHTPPDQLPTVTTLRLLGTAAPAEAGSSTATLRLRGAEETPGEARYAEPQPGLLPASAEIGRFESSPAECRRRCDGLDACVGYAAAANDCRLYRDPPGKLFVRASAAQEVRDSAQCTEGMRHRCEPLRCSAASLWSWC